MVFICLCQIKQKRSIIITKSIFRITPNFFCSKMKGRWEIIIILLAFVGRNKGDTMNELLNSVKNLHDKVDQIGMDQVKTHERVEQLQTKLNLLSLNVKSMPEIDFKEKIATTTSSLTTLDNKILEMDEKWIKQMKLFFRNLKR